MFKIVRSKLIAISLIFSFLLFYSPHLLVSQQIDKGNLVGFIYDKDGSTPVNRAVVRVRNISTGSVYESQTDKQGAFDLEGVDEGLYVIGISTEKGDFNLNNLIGIRANETAKISFALRPMAQEGTSVKKDEKCPLGEWYIPQVAGECEKGYKWNKEKKRCECVEKVGLVKFFSSPVGVAVIIAASLGVVYALVKLAEAEPEASPFR